MTTRLDATVGGGEGSPRAGAVAAAASGSGRPRLRVPAAVIGLVKRLEEAGFETWTVGGAVRDAWRGGRSEPQEWDLATRASPAEVRALFRRTVPLGVEYGTVGVFGGDGALYEVTTFRRDVITYGRKAVVAFADSLDEDLARRDFTVNAMAWHPLRRELRDPHDGRRDLERRALRAVGDPAERFREDYLRVLRGLRFAGALGLEIEPETWTGMTEAVPGLAHLSMERVREELLKVLRAEAPSRSLELYERSGALREILPELDAGLGPEALAVIDAVRGRRAEIRLAAMLCSGRKGPGGRKGPVGRGGRAGRGAVAEILARLRFSKAETDRVAAAASAGLAPTERTLRCASARRRWAAGLGRAGVRDVFRLWLAAARAGAARGGDLIRLIADARRDMRAGVPMSVGDLAVAGRDLLALGWPPGPRVGRALRRLLEEVWRDPGLNRRGALLDLAAEWEGGAREGDQ